MAETTPEPKEKKPANPTDYLANERTFLAWIRTSIAVMAFGFVVVKFGLYNKQLSLLMGASAAAQIQEDKYSTITGVALVAFGTIITLLAFVRFKQIDNQLNKRSYQSTFRLSLLLTIAILLVGLLLVFYLTP